MNANFLVGFGGGGSRPVSMGFAEVIFPTFTAGNPGWHQEDPAAAEDIGVADTAADNHVILKRGVTGNLDLYHWWDKARRGKAPKHRTLMVELLSEDQATVVLTWRFRNVRPVSLTYSPLRAIEGGIVMETLALGFDSMEMA